MKKAVIICVGKIKTPYWQKACGHYLTRLSSWRKIVCLETRDSAAALPPAARLKEESCRILACLQPSCLAIALHEQGDQMNSRQFAAFLRHCDEKLMQTPCFIIGGPFGLDKAVLDACARRLSLSAMTWPHELARALLLEQIYRAESILRGAPYHH